MSDATLKMPEILIMILVQDTFFRQKKWKWLRNLRKNAIVSDVTLKVLKIEIMILVQDTFWLLGC